jgi:hypothetical protein
VLVKWWLLAIPHYLIVDLFIGGGSWLAWNNEHWESSSTGGGLIGLLVLIAAIVLAFTGRYASHGDLRADHRPHRPAHGGSGLAVRIDHPRHRVDPRHRRRPGHAAVCRHRPHRGRGPLPGRHPPRHGHRPGRRRRLPRLPGRAPELAPAQQGFWTVQSSGTGTRTLVWPVEEGSWTVVVMNADGSRGVDVRADVGAKAPALEWISLGLLAGGLVLLGGAVALLVFAVRRPAATP